MFRKWFLVSLLGGFAVLFVAVDVAQAQLRDRRASSRERRLERRDSRRGIVTATVEAPLIVEASSTVRISNYPSLASEGMVNAAQIRVILPDAHARVWFDETATKQMGTDRLFYTPPLTAGAANKYRIRVTFMQGDREVPQERVVSVAPGRTYVLDFTRR